MPFKTIENQSGIGSVYRGTKSVADVRYAIQVRQHIRQFKTASVMRHRGSKIEIDGIVTTLYGQKNLYD